MKKVKLYYLAVLVLVLGLGVAVFFFGGIGTPGFVIQPRLNVVSKMPTGLLPSPKPSTAIAKTCGITITAPAIGQKVSLGPSNTIVIQAMTKPEDGCAWTVFEAQAGLIKIYTKSKELVGKGVLATQGDWMTTSQVFSESIIELTKVLSSNTELFIEITEEDPSGEGMPDSLTIPVIVQ